MGFSIFHSVGLTLWPFRIIPELAVMSLDLLDLGTLVLLDSFAVHRDVPRAQPSECRRKPALCHGLESYKFSSRDNLTDMYLLANVLMFSRTLSFFLRSLGGRSESLLVARYRVL